MENHHDYIVVGSGPSGAQAAQTLVEAGVNTAILDVGNFDDSYDTLIPKTDFEQARKTDSQQFDYLIGKNYESLNWGKTQTGSQLTPSRNFVLEKVKELLPFKSETFFPMESLAYGGLGSAWGLGCCVFSKSEIEQIGLDYKRISEAYKVINSRIGISSASGDIVNYTQGNLDMLPKLDIDNNAKSLLEKYNRKKGLLNRRGFYMGQPSIALLSEKKENRNPEDYHDWGFYTDRNLTAYRPWITVNKLKKSSNFSYYDNKLVLTFKEKDNLTIVKCYDLKRKIEIEFQCKKLIIAAGALGTSRIVLRSLHPEKKLPLLCNPYIYLPCFNANMIGRIPSRFATGFVQLALFHDANHDNTNVAMASLYSYRSLMLFRLLKESPLNFREGRKIMQLLQSCLVIGGIHQPDQYSKNKELFLKPDSESLSMDCLSVNYSLTEQESIAVKNREKKFIHALQTLKCYPIKKVNPGFGASIHYAGTLPFSKEKNAFTLNSLGVLHGTKNVYVADGSGFKYLPAKGLTLTLMANAHVVAKNVLER